MSKLMSQQGLRWAQACAIAVVCCACVMLGVASVPGKACAFEAQIDTVDDAYIAPAGTNDWTSEHDAVYQSYVGDTVDFCSDMSLDPVLGKMNAIEAQYPGVDTSIVKLLDAKGDLAVTIQVPEGLEFNVDDVYMLDNDLYQITGKSMSGTVVGPGQFTVNMGLKKAFASYDELKAAMESLSSCNMPTAAPNDGFAKEIRVVFPNVKVGEAMVNQNVAAGSGTMSGEFSATASIFGGLVTRPFVLSLASHQYPGGVDAVLPADSAITQVTLKVNPATTVTVSKTWDHGTQASSDWPQMATVHLWADGVEVAQAQLSADGSWSHVFSALDPSKTYTITEDAIDGYTTTIGTTTGSAATGYAIATSSVYSGPAFMKSVKAVKAWDDGNDADGIRPQSVKLQLQETVAGTTKAVEGKTIELTAANGWRAELTGLPANENGELITYSFIEQDVPQGYAASYSADGCTVTNTHTSEKATPGQSQTAQTTQTTTQTTASSGGAAASNGTPATADQSGVAVCILLVIVLASAACAVRVIRRAPSARSSESRPECEGHLHVHHV